jgi:hypothetical protein
VLLDALKEYSQTKYPHTMYHSWDKKTNKCKNCGITRKKLSAKVIKHLMVVDREGCLEEKEETKTVKLWHYSGYGFQRPDCPDELKIA